MPALITHQLIAEEILNKLDEKYLDRIADRNMFCFGAQGGDPYYVYKYMSGKKKINFGIALHRGDVYATFSYFKDFLGLFDDVASFSYVMGYISHYATDIVFHPFVYYLIEKYKQNDDKVRQRDKLHYLIEGDIDVYLLQKYRDTPVKDYVYPLKHSDIRTEKLFTLMQKPYLDLCGEELNRASFKRCMKRFFFYNRMLDDKNFKKQRFFGKFENFFGISHILSYMFKRETPDDRYTNVENDVWHNLDNPEGQKTKSASELFEESIELSVKLIEEFIAALDSKQDLSMKDFSTDFNTGNL